MSDPTNPVSPAITFRRACAQFATGVTAATAIDPEGNIAAMTVNSFTSVSLDPPQILVCIGHKSSSFPVMSKAERIAVHVLADDQEHVARRLATTGLSAEQRLADVAWTAGPGGEPHLKDVAARLAGRTAHHFTSGDHLIIVVEVDHIDLGDHTRPALLFFRGRFVTVGDSPAA